MKNFKDNKRIVVKVGTSTLAHKTGKLNIRRVEKLVKILADLSNSGREIILVSSGAMGLGMGKLGLVKKPTDTPSKQALAAVGQCELMYMYDKMFGEYNIVVAQLLLTKYILLDERKANVENAVHKLLELGLIPIVNENDTVAIDELELEMGENDSLAATIAAVAKADALVILSDIDGLFDDDPKKNEGARLISVVRDIDNNIKAVAKGAGSKLGTGGMATKIKAAEIASQAGIDTVIMNGRTPEKLYDLFQGKQIGTRFVSGD